jgi:hypothetical protein
MRFRYILYFFFLLSVCFERSSSTKKCQFHCNLWTRRGYIYLISTRVHSQILNREIQNPLSLHDVQSQAWCVCLCFVTLIFLFAFKVFPWLPAGAVRTCRLQEAMSCCVLVSKCCVKCVLLLVLSSFLLILLSFSKHDFFS